MERAERIIALAAGLAFPVLLVPVLWLMLALTTLTAVQRFAKVWRQASIDRPASTHAGRMGPVSERFRAWRTTQLADLDWRAGARWRTVREQRSRRRRRSSATRRP